MTQSEGVCSTVFSLIILRLYLGTPSKFKPLLWTEPLIVIRLIDIPFRPEAPFLKQRQDFFDCGTPLSTTAELECREVDIVHDSVEEYDLI